MLPFEILFAEHHSPQFKLPINQRFAISGLILRQIWTWTSLVIIFAYTSGIKSTLIKKPELKLISQIHEIPNSQIPIYYVADYPEYYDLLEHSSHPFEQWLHANIEEVLTLSDQ